MASNKNSFFSFVGATVFFVAVAACSTERGPCLVPTVPKMNVSCLQYKSDNNEYVDTSLPNANFVSLEIDSAKLWYWGAKSLSKFQLVLSPLSDTARWALQVDSSFSPIDTIVFIYERQLKFYSNACGYGYTYNMKNILFTKNNLDSVVLSNNEITTKAGTENVKIYF